jgi:hypothetical protein
MSRVVRDTSTWMFSVFAASPHLPDCKFSIASLATDEGFSSCRLNAIRHLPSHATILILEDKVLQLLLDFSSRVTGNPVVDAGAKV